MEVSWLLFPFSGEKCCEKKNNFHVPFIWEIRHASPNYLRAPLFLPFTHQKKSFSLLRRKMGKRWRERRRPSGDNWAQSLLFLSRSAGVAALRVRNSPPKLRWIPIILCSKAFWSKFFKKSHFLIKIWWILLQMLSLFAAWSIYHRMLLLMNR